MSKRISTKIPRYGTRKLYELDKVSEGVHNNEMAQYPMEISGEQVMCRAIFPKSKFVFFGENGRMLLGFFDDCIVEIIEFGKTNWVVKPIEKINIP